MVSRLCRWPDGVMEIMNIDSLAHCATGAAAAAITSATDGRQTAPVTVWSGRGRYFRN
ncbi:hypothetical protein KCP73_00445 [Salmonella enterica subsp. enterica]|nr:hypothetical protein KCP73_00445 [Salmonella enterica subsp. enterica]